MHGGTEGEPPYRVRLETEGELLRFAVTSAGSPGGARQVPVGQITRVRSFLRHEPVTASALEAAIEEVEDLVMPALRGLPAGARLDLPALAWREVVEALPQAATGRPVSVEEVEALFNRLADVASGSPAGRLGVPTTASFALGLLLLREVMHHGGFTEVWVTP